MSSGRFIQIDGIDGSGKSVLLNAARAWAESRGLTIFDTVEWCKRERVHPSLEDVGDADVLLTAEPSHAGVGWAIRHEIIRNGTPYDAAITSHAYALDRGVQYKRLTYPFLEARPGRWVFQDRGLLTSLAYQPLQYETEQRGDPVTIEWLLALPGNRIALERVPDVFVFLDIDPAIAQARLAGRTDKRDDARFEQRDFLFAAAERFRNPSVMSPLADRGTRVHMIDGGKTREAIATEMTKLLEELAMT